MLDWRGLQRGLQATRPYLLSHHVPAAWDRCYTVHLSGRRVRLCARCLGIYPGIAIGLIVSLIGPTWAAGLLPASLLPLPALLEWTTTTVGSHPGRNPIRTATGLLLGYAYGIGLTLLLIDGDLRIIAVGFFYAGIAGSLLWRRYHRERDE